jgi:hypothetical protein
MMIFDPHRWLKERAPIEVEPQPPKASSLESESDIIAKVLNAFSSSTFLGIVQSGEPGLFDWAHTHPLEPSIVGDSCWVCGGACEWCRTPGILRCGHCHPRRSARSWR